MKLATRMLMTSSVLFVASLGDAIPCGLNTPKPGIGVTDWVPGCGTKDQLGTCPTCDLSRYGHNGMKVEAGWEATCKGQESCTKVTCKKGGELDFAWTCPFSGKLGASGPKKCPRGDRTKCGTDEFCHCINEDCTCRPCSMDQDGFCAEKGYPGKYCDDFKKCNDPENLFCNGNTHKCQRYPATASRFEKIGETRLAASGHGNTRVGMRWETGHGCWEGGWWCYLVLWIPSCCRASGALEAGHRSAALCLSKLPRDLKHLCNPNAVNVGPDGRKTVRLGLGNGELQGASLGGVATPTNDQSLGALPEHAGRWGEPCRNTPGHECDEGLHCQIHGSSGLCVSGPIPPGPRPPTGGLGEPCNDKKIGSAFPLCNTGGGTQLQPFYNEDGKCTCVAVLGSTNTGSVLGSKGPQTGSIADTCQWCSTLSEFNPTCDAIWLTKCVKGLGLQNMKILGMGAHHTAPRLGRNCDSHYGINDACFDICAHCEGLHHNPHCDHIWHKVCCSDCEPPLATSQGPVENPLARGSGGSATSHGSATLGAHAPLSSPWWCGIWTWSPQCLSTPHLTRPQLGAPALGRYCWWNIICWGNEGSTAAEHRRLETTRSIDCSRLLPNLRRLMEDEGRC